MDEQSASTTETSRARGSGGANHGGGRLTAFIIGAIVLAIVLAVIAPRFAVMFHLGGEIFLRLLQMVVVPLVMASVMSGILGLGDIRKLGRPGGAAIAYYMSTTILAVITGLIVVNLVDPGENIDPKLVEDARSEGAQQVDKVKQARDSGKNVTWDLGTQSQRRRSGESDPVAIPQDHGYRLEASLTQVGEPGRVGRVLALWSSDGKQFRPLEPPLVGQAEPGVVTQEWELPEDARRIKLDFTHAEQGHTVVSGRLVRGPPTIGDIFENLVLMLFTDNLLGSMVEINLLPLIVFSIVFAGMLTTMGAKSQVIAGLVHGINDALLNFILLLMRLAPIGIFCLVTARFAQAQLEGQFLELIRVQFRYMLTVVVGLSIHALITLPLLLWVFTRRNPFRFIGQMSQAILTAFSTASSTATLPVTMECAEMRAGVSRRSTEFVLPLGATINMDGTALYEAAAAIFIAQAYAVMMPGFELTFTQQVTIAMTATLAAIGAAGIPEAGLVTMLIVLNAVQLPLELIGLILPVDWLLDRFRTAVNAFGDSVGAAIVDQTFDSEEGSDERAPPAPPAPAAGPAASSPTASQPVSPASPGARPDE